MRPANAALVRNRERAALQFLQRHFPRARLLGQIVQFTRKFEQTLFVHVANDRNNQPLLSVDGHTDVVILLVDDHLRDFVKARIEDRMFLERGNDGF